MGKQTLVFDVETTGLAAHDRVVAIAGVWCDGLKPTGEHIHLVFNPGKASHPAAFAAHGLADWWLRFQPAIDRHAEDLLAAFRRADLVVGHNVGFDLRMMHQEFGRCGDFRITAPAFCTMEAFRARAGGRASLDAALAKIGLKRQAPSHNAFEDSFLTMNLFRWLKGRKDRCPLPEPLPPPSNAARIPKDVIWADLVDSTPIGVCCPPPPEPVLMRLSELGIELSGHSPRTARLLLAAHDYARAFAKRMPGADRQMRGLICALADADAFHEALVEWSRWSWGRSNPQLPHNALRRFAEELLAALV